MLRRQFTDPIEGGWFNRGLGAFDFRSQGIHTPAAHQHGKTQSRITCPLGDVKRNRCVATESAFGFIQFNDRSRMDQRRLFGMRNAYLTSQPLERIGSSEIDSAVSRR